MKKSAKILLSILCVIFICIFSFSAYKLITITHSYKVSEKNYDGLSDRFVSAGNHKKPDIKEAEKDNRDPEVSPIEVDFDALLDRNKDVAGWIYQPDTAINYPIVQGEDNFFYLHRMLDLNEDNPDGYTYNAGGSIFMDCLNQRDFSSTNTILYGHNMNDGSMFASIKKYASQEYYDQHPTMYINTPDGNYRVEIFAGYVTDADSDSYRKGFGDDDDYQEFLDKICSQSDFKSKFTPSIDDKIVTLSTCSYEYYDARYVVHGIMVPIH